MASMLRIIFCMPLDGEDSEEDFTADLNPADANLSDSGGGDCAIDALKEGKGATSYKRIRKMIALKRELAGLKNIDFVKELPGTYSKPKEGRRACSMSRSQHEDSLIVKICQLRGKFTIMYMLWMSHMQESFQTKLNVDYTPMDRFKPSIEWKRQGEQADLREVFPIQFHGDFEDDFLHPTHKFNLGMSNEHSNSTSRIRNCWCYENCRELIGWQAGTNGPVFYLLLAPILYCNYKGRHDVKKVFLNQSLFDIFNVIIRGPGALNWEPGAKSMKGAVTNDIIWELKEVTPGAIAASTVFACFALSNDLSFQCQGSTSGIDYEADFNTYLKYLISGRTQNQHSIKQIFSIWNNYFFPGIIQIETIGAVPVHALNDVFAALNEDSSGDEQTPVVPATPTSVPAVNASASDSAVPPPPQMLVLHLLCLPLPPLHLLCLPLPPLLLLLLPVPLAAALNSRHMLRH
ncbi:hypothetical protein K439DRAFT_1619249 [Ramaria rubella]|nr:hypothetical protein K439DRAFT_1619249 [Ramaria rubella]